VFGPFRLHLSALSLIWVGIASLASQSAAFAQAESVSPGINRHYQGADYARWRSTFESPQREIYAQREAIVRALRLAPGMAVADIGSGTGFFSLLLAKDVAPNGQVYAVDISPTFVENTVRRANEQGLHNVRGVIGTPHSTSLPDAAVDLAFLCDTYHHFEYPQDMLQSIHRAIRPGGTLFVIDYRKIPGESSDWVISHVRADQGEVVAEIEAQGFRLVQEIGLLLANYVLRFEKI